MRSLLVGLLAACGDNSEPPGTPITLTFDNPLVQVAVRDNDHWKTPRMTGPGAFTTDVHGPYLVAALYTIRLTRVYQLEARTPDDDPLVVTSRGPASFVALSAKAAQPGTLFLGIGKGTTTMADQVLWVETVPGTEDLLGLFGDRAILQRGIVVDPDPMQTGRYLGELDLTNAIPLDTVAFTAADARPTDAVTARLEFQNPTFPFAATTDYGDPSAVRVLPDTALAADDRQSVSVCATTAVAGAVFGGDARCRLQRYHAGASTAYSLPSLVGGVGVGEQDAAMAFQWSQLETDVTGLTGDLWGMNDIGAAVTYQLHATTAYLAAMHPPSLDFIESPPKFTASWKLDPSLGYDWQLSAERGDETHKVSGTVDPAM